MRRPVHVATLVLALALPGAARAASVRVDVDPGDERTDASQTFVYTAAPGEINRPTLTFDQQTSMFTVDDAVPLTLGKGCTRLAGGDATKARCADPSAGNSDARLALGDGDDVANVSLRYALTEIDAGPGNDTVHGDTVDGGPGNDRIFGRSLTGGAGDDVETAEGDDSVTGATFDQGAAPDGDDVLVGGDGEDTVSYAARGGPVGVDLTTGRAGAAGEHDTLRSIEDATGGRGADRLRGTAGVNLLEGARGADRMRAGPGADRLYGGAGDDRLDAGAGDDLVDGESGGDLLLPGAGADQVFGERGNDRIRARDAAIDDVSCGTGRDRVTLNRLDFVRPGCDRRFRTGVPAAVPLGVSTYNQSDEIAAIVGCPADLGRRCAGTVRVRLGSRTFVKRFRGKAGDAVSVTLADSRDNPYYPAFGERVRAVVRAHDRRGRTVIVTRTVHAGIDE